MDMIRNRFKQAVRERRPQIGLWSSLCSNIGAEILADAGFDWILLDTEHSPNELPGLLSQMQAIGRDQTTPVVRAAWNDAVLIKRILDIGAPAVLVPYVQNADEARQAVESVRYPPAGVRGVSAGSRASRRWSAWRRSPPSTASTVCSSGRPIWQPPWGFSAMRSPRKFRAPFARQRLGWRPSAKQAAF